MNSKPARRRPRLCLCLALWTCAAGADERILSFLSEITVNPDASLTVTETIEVRAEGEEIRHGIYRDFPTRYTDRYGRRVAVGFKVNDVRCDGAAESWHQENRGNGVRVYAGRPEGLLAPGIHRYELRYRTTRQLGFFADHDELYWNVTGNGWAFPIDRAQALVRLPAGVPQGSLRIDAYTGPAGARDRDVTWEIGSDGTVRFVTTQGLAPAEGLTIAVGFPKGLVSPPTLTRRIGDFLNDNREVLAGFLGLVLMSGYYLLAWHRAGRDPEGGVVVPQFHPPQSLSAPALRYIYRMGFDHTALSAALLELAARGAIDIRQDGRRYEIARRHHPLKEPLPEEERILLEQLFRNTDTFALSEENHAVLSDAADALEKSLREQHRGRYFRTNELLLLPGVLIGVLTLILAGASRTEDWEGLLVLAGIFAFFPFAGIILPRERWFYRTVLLSLSMIAVFFALAQATTWSLSAIALVMLGATLVFRYLLRARTVPGRKLLDAIEGFRLYLSVAEKERMNTLHPPELTPQLFEKYLPYALALGVEQEWSERFAAQLAQQTGRANGSDYRPSWYRGGEWGDFTPARFAAGLSEAIAAAATAPGATSGLGGGSSGGGGGGGGGGGW